MAVNVPPISVTLRSITATSQTSRLSSATTATMTTMPTTFIQVQRSNSVLLSATVVSAMSASQPDAGPIEPADDLGRVVDRGLEFGQRVGVLQGLLQRGVDPRRLAPDLVGQQQDRYHQGDHRGHHHAEHDEADHPTGVVRHHCTSHQARTGARFALAEAITGPTGAVDTAIASTPPCRAARILVTARRCRITCNNANATTAMIRVAIAQVTQATKGMAQTSTFAWLRLGAGAGCFGGSSFVTLTVYRSAPFVTPNTATSVSASSAGSGSTWFIRCTPPSRMASAARRMRITGISKRFSNAMTTGSTTTSRIAFPIHIRVVFTGPLPTRTRTSGGYRAIDRTPA